MNEKMMKEFSELDWSEAVKVANETASHLKEIAEYMQTDVRDYDAEKVSSYIMLFMKDLEELDYMGDDINAVFEKNDFEHSINSVNCDGDSDSR